MTVTTAVVDASTDAKTAPQSSYHNRLAFALGSFGTQVVLGLGSSILSARLYGVTIVGQFALASAAWLTVIILSTLSEQVAFVRVASLSPAKDRSMSALFVWVLAFSTALTAVVGIAVWALGAGLLTRSGSSAAIWPAAALLTAYLCLDNVSWNVDMALQSHGQNKAMFVARLAQGITLVIGTIAGAATHSLWGLVCATAASMLVGLVVRVGPARSVLALDVTRDEMKAATPEFRKVLRFGIRLTPGAIAGGLAPQVAVWSLGRTATIADLGAFGRANSLATRINDIGYRTNEALLPALMHEGSDAENAAVTRTVGILAVVLGLSAAVVAADPRAIMSIFGHSFLPAAHALAFLTLAYIANVLAFTVGNVLVSRNHPTWTSAITVSRLAVSLALVIPLAIKYGATGAGAGLAGAMVFDLVVRLIVTIRLGYGADIKGVVPMIGAVTVAAGVATFVTHLYVAGPGFTALLESTVCASVIFISLIALAIRVMPPFAHVRKLSLAVYSKLAKA